MLVFGEQQIGNTHARADETWGRGVGGSYLQHKQAVEKVTEASSLALASSILS